MDNRSDDAASDDHRPARRRAKPDRRPLRLLQIGQDDLFSGAPGWDVDFYATGNSITPHVAGRRPLKAQTVARLISELSGRGTYDLAVMPVIRFGWPYDTSRLKRKVRHTIRRLLQWRSMADWIGDRLRRKAGRVVAFDRYDQLPIDDAFIQAIRPLETYYKTNLRPEALSMLAARPDGSVCRHRWLPYWVDPQNYPPPVSPDKRFDISFVGEINSEQRRIGVEVLRRLKDQGLAVEVITDRIAFEAYRRITAESWLTLSPEGHGYNGFRHYEAMLLSSVPVINRPDPPVVHDFVDRINCLLYDAVSLKDVIRESLHRKDRLAAITDGLRRFAMRHHSLEAVRDYVLRDQGFPAGEP